MIGKTISHYKITQKLGEGGMGVVYKAVDTKLDRPVALKFLPPESTRDPSAKARFIHEAQTAAQLSHTNIATVYEIGEADHQLFIAMEYVQGMSLKEKIADGPLLALTEVLDLVEQIAAGLQEAHDHGVVHRDIKPANIMLAPKGKTKILDFGLAWTQEATRLTKTGTILGTAGYMSPEQAMGEATDYRTDLWCLGIVLYEMVTGRRPFPGDHDQAVIYAILNQNPDPVTSLRNSIPLEVEQIIDKLLEKEPEKRYASAEALITDLEELRANLDLLPLRSQMQLKLLRQRKRIAWVSTAVVFVTAAVIISLNYFTGDGPRIDSIAVLPFENLTGDSAEDLLIEGMTMELTTTLGRVSGFKKVMPYRSMKLFKGTGKATGEIAERMDVEALVAATISKENSRTKVIVEMIEGTSERLLWTQAFEVEKGKQRDVMEAMVSQILARSGVGLTEGDVVSIAKSRSDNPDAQLAYLRGRALSLSYSEENLIRGIKMLENAVQLDSTFALAVVELSCAYSSYGGMYTSGHEEYPKAKRAALKALELDDGLADAYMALAGVQSTFEWDWAGAEKSWKRALELGQNNADVRREYGIFLAFMTRFDEAVEEVQLAIELDPLNLANQQTLGWILYHAARFDESIAQFEKLLVLLEEFPNPAKEFQVKRQLIWDFRHKGMYEEALSRIDKLQQEPGIEAELVDRLDLDRACILFKMGRGDEVKDLIVEILSMDLVMPSVADDLGDRDLAIKILERFYEEKNTYMVFTKMAVELEGLRSDPRYDDLIRKLNFPE